MAVPVLFKVSNKYFSFSTSINEDGYRLSKGANFNETEIIGRSSPVITYSSSTAMTLEATVQLWALQDAKTEVSDVVSTLLSLVFPESPGVQPPSLCYVTLGSILQQWPCVCSKVDPHVAIIPNWDSGGEPMTAVIGLSFIGVENTNVPAAQWRKRGSFQQTQFFGLNGG